MNRSHPLWITSLLCIVSLAAAQTRPHNFKLVDVKWHVDLKTYEESGTLNGDVVNTLTLLHDPDSVSFDCAKLHVDKVDVDDHTATFSSDQKMLTVHLPDGTHNGQTVRIHVYYDGHPGAGLYLVPAARAFPAHTNVMYTQGEMEDNRYWLPTWDYPDDKATSEGIVEVAKGEIVISNGKLLEVKEEPDRDVFHWKMDHPHATYLISLIAGKYDKGGGFWGTMPVDYYTPQGLIDWGKVTFGGTENIIDFYSKLTGFPYPYSKFCQSAVPDYMFGGMENITAVTQTIDALHPKSVDELRDATGLVAHELAHQWFGDTVTCNGWSDAWLNEGFATFLPHFWDRKKNGEEAYDLGRYGDFQGALQAHQGDPGRPVVWTGYKNALDMFNNFIYPGGSARMFMLMDQLGEDRFWKSITAYLNEREYTSIDTPMFFDSMSKASGVDLSPFMKQWFYTPAAPNLSVSSNGSQLVISQPKPYFDLNLDVWILNEGNWVKKTVHLTGEQADVDMGSFAGDPALVDPRCFVMANIADNVHYSVADVVSLFNHAPNAGEQARIEDTMMGNLSRADWLAFAKTVKSRRLLERIVGHLGDASEGFLLGLTHDADRGLANTAIGALRHFPKSTEVAARLKELMTSDPDDLIRQNALRTLLDITGDRRLLEKAMTTDAFDDGYRQIALDWLTKSNQDEAREVALGQLAHPSSEPARVQAIRVLGQVKDKPGQKQVYQALTAILKESSFGARSTAIDALAEYGDPAAIPLLVPFQTASLVFFREGSDGAIARLRRNL